MHYILQVIENLTKHKHDTWPHSYHTLVDNDVNYGLIAVDIYVDLDNGQLSLEMNQNCVHSQEWVGALGGVNFFGATIDAYSIDNFSLCEDNDATLCVLGCMDPDAFNYNSVATDDNGSCIVVNSDDHCRLHIHKIHDHCISITRS